MVELRSSANRVRNELKEIKVILPNGQRSAAVAASVSAAHSRSLLEQAASVARQLDAAHRGQGNGLRAKIVPVPQLPIAVVNQIIDANKQAVEAVVVPLQAQIMEQQTIIQAQADEIRKLRERIEKDATHQSQQVIGINNALKDIADQQKKAAAAASAREAQPWWQRLFGG